MSGIWERTLVYLGLREEPEDHVEWDVLESADAASVPSRPTGRPVVRPPDASPAPVAGVRPLRGVPAQAASPAPRDPDRVAVVQVRVFDDVEAVGQNHRAGRPVLFDVSGCERPVDRRVIDFVSGVTYASGGSLRRLTRGGFLLMPAGVTLGAAERERLARLGFPVDADGGAR